MRRHLLLTFVACLWLWPAAVSAAEDVYSPGASAYPYMRLGVGARALGMGSAYAAVAPAHGDNLTTAADPTCVFWNPANVILMVPHVVLEVSPQVAPYDEGTEASFFFAFSTPVVGWAQGSPQGRRTEPSPRSRPCSAAPVRRLKRCGSSSDGSLGARPCPNARQPASGAGACLIA